MRTYDVTFIDKNTGENIIVIRANANGKNKAIMNATKSFKHTHRNINLDDVDISIKQVIVEDEYL